MGTDLILRCLSPTLTQDPFQDPSCSSYAKHLTLARLFSSRNMAFPLEDLIPGEMSALGTELGRSPPGHF